MPYMYILKCADGSYYTGSTWNLEKRLAEHQSGLGAKHTIKRLPVKLVYCEECERIEDAFRREKQVQGWSRKKKEALIMGDTNALLRLAECRNDTHCAGFGFDIGFDSLRLHSGQAAPFDYGVGFDIGVGFDSAQPTPTSTPMPMPSPASTQTPTPTPTPTPTENSTPTPLSRALSGAEGSGAEEVNMNGLLR
ncbi:GIY-YIG nuclease family protein [Nitrosomonas sp. Nm34]|uniref:GIY-YIG nuclease family protein n=1 Tax=Nitrosomonas sp. Nm34 TaxID=1881055 RepID=UPI0008ED4ED5|nr:GIY-YIG nuclease family protein [Nitrosomonas sp. Nm34]SFI82957.1 Predicted endonuclease, GIY-YIG superfamily [Nitrosomonas sp. Nm34]